MSKRTQSESRAETRRQQLAAKKDAKAKSKAKAEYKQTRGKQIADAAAGRKKAFESGGSWAGFYIKMRGFLKDDDALGQIGKYYKKYEKFIKNKATIEYDRNSHTVAVNFKDIVKAAKKSLKGEVKKEAELIANESKDNEGAKRLSGAEDVLNWLETEEWVRELLEQYEQVVVSGAVMFPGFLHVEAGGFSSAQFQFRKPAGGTRKKFSVKKDKVAALVNYGLNEAVAAYMASTINANKFSPNGDLLQRVGEGIQLWWIGRQMSVDKTPIFALPPAVASSPGDRTIMSMCLFPGIFPTQALFPIGNVDKWLINFIINANFHLLSVAGIHICFHKTSLTGVPIPFWITPWGGYFTKPFAVPPLNPLSDLPWKLSPKEIVEELAPMIFNYAVGEGVTKAGEVAAMITAKIGGEAAAAVSSTLSAPPTP